MSQPTSILQIAQELGYLPTEASLQETYEEITLTDEETKIALDAAKKAKARNLESERYWNRVRQLTELPKLTAEQFEEMTLTRGKRTIADFKLRANQTKAFTLLSQYFTSDKQFEDQGYSLRKGIILYGGVGCGKTTMLKLFNQNPLAPYVVISCRKIASQFAEEGDTAIYRYSGEYHATMVENPFKAQTWGICFDDLGTESDRKHFGNQQNVMEAVLLNRYDNLSALRNKTHITTNLSADEIEQQYGTRVRSRMREMFNLIDLSGEDLRK